MSEISVKKIVCGIDPEGAATDAAAFSRWLAGVLGSELHLVHVLEQTERPWPPLAAVPDEVLMRNTSYYVNEVVKSLPEGVEPQVHGLQGHPVKELARFANELPADLLVLGRPHKGVIDRFIGGTAERVLRSVRCPVLVWKGSTVAEPKRLLVPVDVSPASIDALKVAIDWAKAAGGTIRVIHVFEEPTFYPGFAENTHEVIESARSVEREALDKELAAVDFQGVPHDVVHHDGIPSQRVLESAEKDIDLIVMGSAGRSGLERAVLGSVAERVVKEAPCPVLVVEDRDA